jgi:hypothetical protein
MSRYFLRRCKPQTPAEYGVLMHLLSAVFVLLGLAMIVLALRMPPEKHEASLGVLQVGFWCLGIGVAVASAFWVFRWLKDYF